jgi:hypothetical protein
MSDALIGYSGFVGSSLLRQRKFEALFRSSNIFEVHGKAFGLAICAAAPAQKWIANRDPEADRLIIDGLIDNLRQMQAERFVLISTVDVFATPVGVDETTRVDTNGLHAYGLNRYRLEQFVQDHFARPLIVRLPGLVGPGLKKNVIYDFKHDNNVASIDSRSVFQFYPMVNLWFDIEIALARNLRLLHLTAEPVSVADVSALGFGQALDQEVLPSPAQYDMRTVHAAMFGARGSYQYSRGETLLAVRSYAQSMCPPGKELV